ncbi:NGFI-A-binding protein homolog [Pecten maximus]|uniref:NGFI-A-binding protein homolog n=1 Tax=Pecten maximus TaxID=6579 RepID=UPI001458B956|nr:NGFI-A-binding protein homolog [Pecten maximus]XP_033732180.1 NGFI-A-binding protein homolog [Pecten maximus]XP_033732181.1 NGFI-A-binding protein homolog [Pecten maximus]XP_033732182.1 NGFI-A-binding protein homolog [Pecten maximus]XP_033732183.1 NGFI-A-binding protein homolog [Pecten maximus]XP_033732184.1 NGFI-A-binding protein homolog [Pecten maximus]XP_033732185.1 NGFI-A-binding protein homolog [Pecten maximus]XP_033732186.1 NGFI-A-binding protein homolog [Pecten maximus]XP_03373218
MTSTQPRNSSEWQLYRVLQRANLLPYYDTFIGQGGDDVQQLCEAGEDEFLEIMALVGMASKPLHVRRLQKALQEWVSNPAAFQNPMAVSVNPLLGTSNAAVNVTMGGVMTPVRDPQPQQSIIYTSQHSSPVSAAVWTPQLQPAQQQSAPPSQPVQPPPLTPSPQHQVTVVTPVKPQPPPQSSPVPTPISISPGPNQTPTSSSGGSVQGDFKVETFPMTTTSEGAPEISASTSPVPTPVLVESQINSIAEAAAKLAQELPMFETKRLNMKKLINREIMAVMQMSEDDPNRMEELRKYAAIYGRFDSKRKGEKPMSLHEISVNEASAQLCRHRVALLTRREDLFPLARQIVKNSGYQYSKGHSRASDVVVPMTSAKRTRFDPLYIKLEKERITNLSQELLLINQRQEDLKAQLQTAKEAGSVDSEVNRSLQAELEQTNVRQLQLLAEQNEIIQKHKRLQEEDLQSGSSSPRGDNSGDMDEFNMMVRSQLYTAQIPGGLMNDTLFDEGLRIAQQYGMADFAQELKQMHPVGEDSNESGEGEGNTNGVKPTENGQSPKNNGDSVSSVEKPKLLPIKLATTNGTDFAVKTEPVDPVEVNGS